MIAESSRLKIIMAHTFCIFKSLVQIIASFHAFALNVDVESQKKKKMPSEKCSKQTNKTP